MGGVSIGGMDNTPVFSDPSDPSDDLDEAAPVAGIDETDPVEIIEGDPAQVPVNESGDDAQPLSDEAVAERLRDADVEVH